ncbi:MAG TPA: bifunctional phosphoglucose/phosphomannose isomerase [Bacteroidota bacterium]|nr:bifunctional phosphoglucose/phosphomannose isomerase [Bacteroidota bacterium]
MDAETIARIDKSNMFALLRGFPAQVAEAVEIGQKANVRMRTAGLRQIVVCGLGGSAIGGDLLRSYCADELRIPFLVNRHYTLPRFVGPDTLVIISSYSGNTEETNAAHREAIKRKARILCISSGGMTASLARKMKSPLITVPGGLPPRAALGYSFFPLLLALTNLGLIGNKQKELKETRALLEARADVYSSPDPASNPALALAMDLQHRIVICYSSTERFDTVNTRWRGQIAENGKSLAFGHVLPEMNHNELVGWKVLSEAMGEMHVLFLRDTADHPRVQIRMGLTRDIIGHYTDHVTEVWSEGKGLLARMFSLITLGDWVSYYLAILHGEDPTPVAVINHLKTELGKVQ